MPQDKQIRTVETLLVRCSGSMYGFKWIGDDGAVLVAVGNIDWPYSREASYIVLQSFTLKRNQRLLGVRSSSGVGNRYAHHYSF